MRRVMSTPRMRIASCGKKRRGELADEERHDEIKSYRGINAVEFRLAHLLPMTVHRLIRVSLEEFPIL